MKKNEEEQLKEAAEIIKNGGLVVFPTETVYGIGTNGLDKEAVKRLYSVKKRPLNKPISLLVSNFEMIDKVATNISELEYKIMKTFFPGPLTIVLNKKGIVPKEVTANGDTVGVRMPANDEALKLIEFSGVPIATPSANISGKPSGTNINMIKNDFGDKVDCYIDGGESKLGIGSTIVKVRNNQIIILRQGSITKEELEKLL
jgi:L-threonylcarbamoyladenylate synthase